MPPSMRSEFGDPFRDDIDMGTVIDITAARRVAERVDATIASHGGKLLTGGTHDGKAGRNA